MTCAEAAYRGVPLIVTSHGFPEIEWQGGNIAELGVGVHLDKYKMTAPTLRAAAHHVLRDEAIRNRVSELKRCVRRSPVRKRWQTRSRTIFGSRAIRTRSGGERWSTSHRDNLMLPILVVPLSKRSRFCREQAQD